MLSLESQTSLETPLFRMLVVGFKEADFPPPWQAVLASHRPQIQAEWVPTDQLRLAQIESSNRYDLIFLDCRQQGGMPSERALEMKRICQESVILGLTDLARTEGEGCGNGLECVEYLVDETQVISALKWALQQAWERKQFLRERDHLQGQLGEAAYKIEMADVASTVLHNVGNVLNSVNVAANLVESVVNQSSVTLVNRMADLLKDHKENLGTFLTQDPKGKRIPPSMEKLGNHLIQEQQMVLQEISGLVRNLHHVKQIISSHQTMAKSGGQVEGIFLVELLDHAMELSMQPGDAKWITVQRHFQEVPSILGDKHQLLQILVNLLRNAKQAMRQDTQEMHTLILRVESQGEDGSCVVITIQDSGIGIAPEHLSRIFTRGFTTKQDGNGIGLHSAVIAIQNMGGSLQVHSDGMGMGATFTLTFPVQMESVKS
ncbi:MAG: HAMP domain-containing sensor histidine kinase [Nitrospirales bacterium]